MGFFSDIIRMAASEVANAVMDGVNEVVASQEEQTQYLEELKAKYSTVAYSTLKEFVDENVVEGAELTAIKNVLSERADFVNRVRSLPPEEAFCEFDDQNFVDYYNKLIETRGALFSEQDAKALVRQFQKELMARPIAKRMYAQSKEDYFDEFRYDELETVILGNDAFYDAILKAEAERELEYRNSIISLVKPDVIDDLDNDEFMQIYALVRSDEERVDYDNLMSGSGSTAYHQYFGEVRDQMLKICENEFITNRGFLIRQFILEYCEDELETYSNFSDKKLRHILESEGTDNNSDAETADAEQYDLCSKLIAKNILNERGGE